MSFVAYKNLNPSETYDQVLQTRSELAKNPPLTEKYKTLREKLFNLQSDLWFHICYVINNTPLMKDHTYKEIAKKINKQIDYIGNLPLEQRFKKLLYLSQTLRYPELLLNRITLTDCGPGIAALMIDKFVSAERIKGKSVSGKFVTSATISNSFSTILLYWIHRPYFGDDHFLKKQETIVRIFASKGLFEKHIVICERENCSCLRVALLVGYSKSGTFKSDNILSIRG